MTPPPPRSSYAATASRFTKDAVAAENRGDYDKAADYRAAADAYTVAAKKEDRASQPLRDRSEGQNPALYEHDRREVANERHAAEDRLRAGWEAAKGAVEHPFHHGREEHKIGPRDEVQ